MKCLVGTLLFIITVPVFAQDIEFTGLIQSMGSFNVKDYKSVNLVTVKNDTKHKVIKRALTRTLKLVNIKVDSKSKALVSIHVKEESIPNGVGSYDLVPFVTIKAIDINHPEKTFEGLYKIIKTSDRNASKFHAILGAQTLMLGKKSKRPSFQSFNIEKKAVNRLISYYGKK